MTDGSALAWAETARELGLDAPGVNLAAAVIDRHPDPARLALISLDRSGWATTHTVGWLREESNRLAGLLVRAGIQPGDRVFTFLERSPLQYAAALAIIKAGAVYGPLFASFGTEALRDRLGDAGARAILTTARLLPTVTAVRQHLPGLETVILLEGNGSSQPGADALSYPELRAGLAPEFAPVLQEPDAPAIIHYTSGTTGRPKGALHGHRALIGHVASARVALDLRPDDLFWCTADPAWVTGSSYGIFAPLAVGATQLLAEAPLNATAFFGLIAAQRVSVLYTAPTLLRLLMRGRPADLDRLDISSLRHTASVGEPLNPEVIRWWQQQTGQPVHDTWFQTETGSIMIAQRPGIPLQIGAMGCPLPGVEAAILDDGGEPLPPGEPGRLALRAGWPSCFLGYWRQPELTASRWLNGWYLAGDLARCDQQGYFWFIGRADEVINTAGHLVSPFEVESALLTHGAVAEAAAVGTPDPLLGEKIVAFVSLREGQALDVALEMALKRTVRQLVSPFAVPQELVPMAELPKTQSGKILRRLLRSRLTHKNTSGHAN